MKSNLYPFAQKWFENKSGSCWITSDLHFGDEELRKGHPDRPTDEDIIQSINQSVGRFGTLIILGDCGDPESVKKLRGYKILIAGNHDNIFLYKDIFDEIYHGPVMIHEKLLLSHEPINVDWAVNIHGHDHNNQTHVRNKNQFNVNIDVFGIKPLHLGRFLKNGGLSKIKTLHRSTIDKATERKKKKEK